MTKKSKNDKEKALANRLAHGETLNRKEFDNVNIVAVMEYLKEIKNDCLNCLRQLKNF